MEIKKVININKRYGGILINMNDLGYSIEMANKEKNIYRKNAYVIRGIIVDHPFLNGNKRTATEIILKNFRDNNYKCDRRRLSKGIINIAKQNITDLNKISMRLRKWCIKK